MNAQNYLINYYYAFVLSREGMGEDMRVMGYTDEAAAKMRAELQKSIDLRPDFPESYKLLAFINLVTNTQLDESITFLKRVLAASPGRSDLQFILAQVYMGKEEFKPARALLEKLSQGNSEVRESARAMLASLTTHEEQIARFHAAQEATDPADGSGPPRLIRGSASEQNPVEVKTDPYAYLEEALRKPAEGEKRVQGILTRIDCVPKSGITFLIKVGERTLRLRTERFEDLKITTYTGDVVGDITCGVRKPENPVVMCFLPLKGPRARADGTAKSLEFVPKDFKLQADPGSEKAPE